MYKVGDTITITQEMVNALGEGDTTYRFHRGKNDWSSWLGKKGICYVKRLGRSSHGQMAIEWGSNEKTNTYWLEDIGLEFEKVDCPELPIMECPEEYLSMSELVIKVLILDGNTEAEATAKVYEITRAMAEREIVFYRP